MDEADVLGKKIKVLRQQTLFYTIIKILENTPSHVLFLDNRGEKIYCRWEDIIEVVG